MKSLIVKWMEINEAMGLFKLKEQEMFGCEMAENQ